MKTLIVTVAFLLASVTVYSQRNSEVDPKDAQIDTLKVQIDSLTKATKSLSMQLDSISGELVKYVGLYNTIKEKVLHYSFDPTRSAYLIDSLAASRDSTAAMLAITKIPPISPSDTIKTAPPVSPVVPVPAEELERDRALNGLKQLKELLDARIITDVEFIALKKKYLEKL